MIKAVVHQNGLVRFPQMFPSSESDEHLYRYFRIVGEGLGVSSHSDLLRWLQGEKQYYLPHDILLTLWSEGGENNLRHDLVSGLPGQESGRTIYNP
ncbi:MAG: hypothetical protein ABJA60_11710 [Nitrosospira sp.]